MSVGRQLPKEIQAIFDDPKYGAGIHRTLTKENAVRMFMDEFGMTEEQANRIFVTFDQDKNGKMNLREFRRFYGEIGMRAQQILDLFHSMDTNKNGTLEVEEAREGLKALKTSDGKEISQEEIDFCIDHNKGTDGVIDLSELATVLLKLRVITPRGNRK